MLYIVRLLLLVGTLAGVMLLTPRNAMADAGAPMIIFTLPGMIIVLIPVILLEAVVIKRHTDLPHEPVLKASIMANVFTTVVGIPATWFVLVVIQFLTGGGGGHQFKSPLREILDVTLYAAWQGEGPPYWVVPAAIMWMLIPSFIVSCWLEFLVVSRMLREIDKGTLKRAVIRANLLSYGLLELVALVMVFCEL